MQVMSIAQLIRSEYDNSRDLSGIGGIETGQDAAEFLLLGANSVQVRPSFSKQEPFCQPQPPDSRHAGCLRSARQASAASLSEQTCLVVSLEGACRSVQASCFTATRWSSSCAEACRCCSCQFPKSVTHDTNMISPHHPVTPMHVMLMGPMQDLQYSLGLQCCAAGDRAENVTGCI